MAFLAVTTAAQNEQALLNDTTPDDVAVVERRW